MTFSEWAVQNNLAAGTEVYTWAEAAWSWGRQDMLREMNEGVALAHSDAYQQGRLEQLEELLQYDDSTALSVLNLQRQALVKEELTVDATDVQEEKEKPGRDKGRPIFDDEPPRAD